MRQLGEVEADRVVRSHFCQKLRDTIVFIIGANGGAKLAQQVHHVHVQFHEDTRTGACHFADDRPSHHLKQVLYVQATPDTNGIILPLCQ